MNSTIIVIVSILLSFIFLGVILLLLVKYINKRDKGNLRFHIKLGFFEFEVNTSGENVIQRQK